MPVVPARLSAWTWLLPLPLLHLATWFSLATQFTDGAALWYLPYAIGLVLVLWWGPRVLLAVYLNALLCVPLWGLDWRWAPLYAIPETLGVTLAWLMLRLPWVWTLTSLPRRLKPTIAVSLPAKLILSNVPIPPN